ACPWSEICAAGRPSAPAVCAPTPRGWPPSAGGGASYPVTSERTRGPGPRAALGAARRVPGAQHPGLAGGRYAGPQSGLALGGPRMVVLERGDRRIRERAEREADVDL